MYIHVQCTCTHVLLCKHINCMPIKLHVQGNYADQYMYMYILYMYMYKYYTLMCLWHSCRMLSGTLILEADASVTTPLNGTSFEKPV